MSKSCMMMTDRFSPYKGGNFYENNYIALNSINDVKLFVNIVNRYDYEVDLTSGRYVVDAKSIMGIFSLDLAKPIKVEIHNDNCQDLLDELKPYII